MSIWKIRAAFEAANDAIRRAEDRARFAKKFNRSGMALLEAEAIADAANSLAIADEHLMGAAFWAVDLNDDDAAELITAQFVVEYPRAVARLIQKTRGLCKVPKDTIRSEWPASRRGNRSTR